MCKLLKIAKINPIFGHLQWMSHKHTQKRIICEHTRTMVVFSISEIKLHLFVAISFILCPNLSSIYSRNFET